LPGRTRAASKISLGWTDEAADCKLVGIETESLDVTDGP